MANPRLVKWWVTRIGNQVWYHGGLLKGKLGQKSQTFWTTNRHEALSYARLHKGELVKARITPVHPCKGNEPAAAEAMGVYKQYIDLQIQDKGKEASRLVMERLKRKSHDLRIISSDQIVVLDPNIITVVNRSPVDDEGRLIKSIAKVKRKPIVISKANKLNKNQSHRIKSRRGGSPPPPPEELLYRGL